MLFYKKLMRAWLVVSIAASAILFLCIGKDLLAELKDPLFGIFGVLVIVELCIPILLGVFNIYLNEKLYKLLSRHAYFIITFAIIFLTICLLVVLSNIGIFSLKTDLLGLTATIFVISTLEQLIALICIKIFKRVKCA